MSTYCRIRDSHFPDTPLFYISGCPFLTTLRYKLLSDDCGGDTITDCNALPAQDDSVSDNNHYVYVYIDPRNLKNFYIGMGQGSRKSAHLFDSGDSAKAQRIREIRSVGLEPVIRVVARELTQREAFLVEKTLIWNSRSQLSNVSSGHFKENFRPANTMHLRLNGFDFENSVYYYNVGEGPHRHWDDYREFGFISAGAGVRYRDAIGKFQPGDVVIAYLSNAGYVGVGQILERARPLREVTIGGKPLSGFPLRPIDVLEHIECDKLSEYACTVRWIKAFDREHAKWEPNSGLFTTTHVRASLDNQPRTISFVEKKFGISLHDYLV